MYTDMDFWTKIRLELLRGETSKREVLRRKGIHWEILKKIIQYSEPPGCRIKNHRPKPKIGPFLEQKEFFSIISTICRFRRESPVAGACPAISRFELP